MNRTNIQGANLSPGYRKFKRQFACQCRKCGCKSCIVEQRYYARKFLFWTRVDYRRTKFGFTCLKCSNSWVHVYSLGELTDRVLKGEGAMKR